MSNPCSEKSFIAIEIYTSYGLFDFSYLPPPTQMNFFLKNFDWIIVTLIWILNLNSNLHGRISARSSRELQRCKNLLFNIVSFLLCILIQKGYKQNHAWDKSFEGVNIAETCFITLNKQLLTSSV